MSSPKATRLSRVGDIGAPFRDQHNARAGVSCKSFAGRAQNEARPARACVALLPMRLRICENREGIPMTPVAPPPATGRRRRGVSAVLSAGRTARPALAGRARHSGGWRDPAGRRRLGDVREFGSGLVHLHRLREPARFAGSGPASRSKPGSSRHLSVSDGDSRRNGSRRHAVCVVHARDSVGQRPGRYPGRPHPAGVRHLRATKLPAGQPAHRRSARLPVPDLGPPGRRTCHRRRPAVACGPGMAREVPDR